MSCGPFDTTKPCDITTSNPLLTSRSRRDYWRHDALHLSGPSGFAALMSCRLTAEGVNWMNVTVDSAEMPPAAATLARSGGRA